MNKFNEEIKKKFIELMESNKHSTASAAKERKRQTYRYIPTDEIK